MIIELRVNVLLWSLQLFVTVLCECVRENGSEDATYPRVVNDSYEWLLLMNMCVGVCWLSRLLFLCHYVCVPELGVNSCYLPWQTNDNHRPILGEIECNWKVNDGPPKRLMFAELWGRFHPFIFTRTPWCHLPYQHSHKSDFTGTIIIVCPLCRNCFNVFINHSVCIEMAQNCFLQL